MYRAEIAVTTKQVKKKMASFKRVPLPDSIGQQNRCRGLTRTLAFAKKGTRNITSLDPVLVRSTTVLKSEPVACCMVAVLDSERLSF